jgi:hypothetical protein
MYKRRTRAVGIFKGSDDKIIGMIVKSYMYPIDKQVANVYLLDNITKKESSAIDKKIEIGISEDPQFIKKNRFFVNIPAYRQRTVSDGQLCCRLIDYNVFNSVIKLGLKVRSPRLCQERQQRIKHTRNKVKKPTRKTFNKFNDKLKHIDKDWIYSPPSPDYGNKNCNSE